MELTALGHRYAEYRKQVHYADCRFAECRYAECRGVLPSNALVLVMTQTDENIILKLLMNCCNLSDLW
jgi:hypothetical protein